MAGYTSNGNGTYAVNYEDERFSNVNNEKETKLNEVNNMYDNMINNSDKYYQEQIDASKEWANTQQNIQQQNTDFAIQKIEQQKAKAEQDYIKEQKGAYTDYTKQSGDYGANAEQMAAQGLTGSGYSESARVSMWNIYQNRYATARQSYNDAVMNYDNAIKEAQLANNETLAKIAYEALQNQLELSLQGFQYKNSLLETKLNQQQNVENTYYNRYQDVLNQINGEINNQMTADERARQQAQWEAEQAQRKEEQALAQRQWEQEMAFKREQAAQEQANWEKEYALTVANSRKSSGGGSSGGSSKKSSSTKAATLSDNGQNIYNLLTSSAANRIKGINTSATKKEYIYQQYAKGNINDTDAELLYAKLGLN